MPERLQKIIARAGITSRRKAEELIVAGRVTVNGEVVRELGSQADASKATICVDGRAIQRSGQKRYLALNKPKGCITTTSDPEGRPTVMDLLGSEASKGLFPVGRLDYNTEGLLLLTNDGDFANRVLTAKNGIPKVYEVKLSQKPTKAGIDRLRNGMSIDGHRVRAEIVRLLRDTDSPWYQVTLVGGRNRQIHRMFERIGILVEKIRRVRIGKVTLRGLEPRQIRELEPEEIRWLMNPPAIPETTGRSAESPEPRLQRSKPAGRRDREWRAPPARHKEPQRKRADRPPPVNRGSGSRDRHQDPQRRQGQSRRDDPNAEKPRRRDTRSTSHRKTRTATTRKPAPPRKRSADPADRLPRGNSTGSRNPETERKRSSSFTGAAPEKHSTGSRNPAAGLKRSARPPRPQGRRQATSSRSPSRARPTGRGASPKRSPSPSRGRQNSRPRSKAKP